MMNKLLITLLFFSSTSFAGWQLDRDNSNINFVSTKQTHIQEIHQITEFEVELKSNSKLVLNMDLSSVETAIPIRNERMKAMLFDVANFRYATLTVALPQGIDDFTSTTVVNAEGTLSLHGKSQPVQLSLLLTPTDTSITGTLLQPLIINAADYDLVPGIEALREVAGLKSIANAIPVSGNIVLHKK
ncbi:YceI family protein [Planctobacterium marinum]|uniref:YceI family protein n=1 Tax=Planctobacterium marinum TaxID=1631968 RepID=UPI001E5C9F41|nr:YceI family protein [Planctobacterium marinum]MCC2606482.1 YceI family protein [Planctobacterium marinum]